MVARAGEAAGFTFLVHSHMLRHSCGYKLANDGQDTRAIQHYPWAQVDQLLDLSLGQILTRTAGALANCYIY